MGVVIDGPRRYLQEFMLARARQGFILCLCSKNVEAGVSRNPRKFRHPKSSPARSASRSIILPPLWNV